MSPSHPPYPTPLGGHKAPLVVFVLFCFIELYELLVYSILEINPLSVASFANIFSHSVGCPFILFMISFAVQKLLSLIRSCLLIFGFIYITVEDPKNIVVIYVKECSACVFL